MFYSTLFFDLDDTLYRRGNGLWDHIRQRMSDYMHERLGLSWEEIPLLRQTYYETYGTTLRGLQQHYRVDADDYLAYVHDLPLENYLQPAPALRKLLLSLPQKRWIFTNADAAHARRVITILGLEDCFDGIIDVKRLNYACKPQLEAYTTALQIAGADGPAQALLLDDSLANLAGARQAGMGTVLVGRAAPPPQIDFAVPDLMSMPDVLPGLWNGDGQVGAAGSSSASSGDLHGS